MDIIRLIGWDRETKKPIWRSVYYNFSLIFLLCLGYDSFFVQEVFVDNWGFTSPYIIKLLIIAIILFSIYFVWGYFQLIHRVLHLEQVIVDFGTHRRSKTSFSHNIKSLTNGGNALI